MEFFLGAVIWGGFLESWKRCANSDGSRSYNWMDFKLHPPSVFKGHDLCQTAQGLRKQSHGGEDLPNSLMSIYIQFIFHLYHLHALSSSLGLTYLCTLSNRLWNLCKLTLHWWFQTILCISLKILFVQVFCDDHLLSFHWAMFGFAETARGTSRSGAWKYAGTSWGRENAFATTSW